ncbi:MAG TPA: tyrosine-protein phosphatase [Burkholderiaceae bacterium]|nr:tyrosine-protein phosphatase [Burkholderiaceae bacterium]
MVKERSLALQGAVNCRDIGGYRTTDRRRVRWGRVLRSDSLSELSSADRAALSAGGVRSIIDLRHEDERLRHPSRWGDQVPVRTHAIGFIPRAGQRLMDELRRKTLSKGAARQLVLEMYRELPLQHGHHYAHLLRLLLEPDALPALVHCTSGKDRTGFGIAVLLSALGVDRETIVADYLLTNRYQRDLAFMVGTDVDLEVLAIVKAADAEYLGAAFDAIERTWGEVHQFIRQGLGLTEQDLAQLQELLLED